MAEDKELGSLLAVTPIIRCSTQWKVADFIKLDSTSLASAIWYLSGDTHAQIIGSQCNVNTSSDPTVRAGTPEDWNMDDYF